MPDSASQRRLAWPGFVREQVAEALPLGQWESKLIFGLPWARHRHLLGNVFFSSQSKEGAFLGCVYPFIALCWKRIARVALLPKATLTLTLQSPAAASQTRGGTTAS